MKQYTKEQKAEILKAANDAKEKQDAFWEAQRLLEKALGFSLNDSDYVVEWAPVEDCSETEWAEFLSNCFEHADGDIEESNPDTEKGE